MVDSTELWETIFKGFFNVLPIAVAAVKAVVGILIGLSFPVALFLFIAIIYCVERLKVIRVKEEQIYDLKVEPAFEPTDPGTAHLANRWESVMKHMDSKNENDWKQAIMEADIILDDILTKMGYRGESVGEKLKRVVTGDFHTLNEAWEAHKVRNQIAHEGSSFQLSEHDAKNVIHMYRKVFEEFYYI